MFRFGISSLVLRATVRHHVDARRARRSWTPVESNAATSPALLLLIRPLMIRRSLRMAAETASAAAGSARRAASDAAAAATEAGASTGSNIYASPSFVGHSLWMMPRAGTPAAAAFDKAIASQAEALSSPTFQPHVSLVAGLMEPIEEIQPKFQELCRSLPRLRARVDDVVAGSLYFQSVYCKLATGDEPDGVVAANKAAQDALAPPPAGGERAPYMPHLSLVYGDFDDETRARAASAVRDDLVGMEFEIDRVQLWSTQGFVADWYMVEECVLGEGS